MKWWKTLDGESRVGALAWLIALAWLSAAVWFLAIVAVVVWLVALGLRRVST